MSLYDVLRRPVVTEKSTLLAEKGKYVFEVSDAASKAQIKEAVKLAFKVQVTQVNVMNVQGKMKRFGRKPTQQRSWKKAIVTLKAGEKIELFGS
ncbi:MAG: 50S ribosomal protein L23 [Dehalococcoidia bacterium]|nr:50S ribosomal protein L23 [Dehalococcoidia bacterium]